MHIRSRGITVLAAAALAAGGLTAATGTSANAAPAVAASCYGSAKSFSTASDNTWPATSYARTTSNCGDINVKPNAGMWVQTCFLTTGACNKATWITGGTWGTAATNVLDGTYFYLHFDRPTSGLVAY
ncbi:hypothetical protein MBT84_38355 [Streptomyces sp. MBT84]|uniref:hypothetical protein n=1 Tax=unclassified Streptomyces TaxID=2593676 RepID=UPI001C6E13CE|nr:hypothetical protein [Streptomyces sp. MBT84]MBW8705483.1 hypothetical protein [Streptomyces sp. MBT84]